MSTGMSTGTGAATGRRVLVAGIGNIFLGDDGFGVEVVKRMAGRPLPAGVHVADYGIRGIHLAFELLDGGYDTLIMVDAVPIDGPPGTLAVIEIPPEDTDEDVGEEAAEDTEDADGGAPEDADECADAVRHDGRADVTGDGAVVTGDPAVVTGDGAAVTGERAEVAGGWGMAGVPASGGSGGCPPADAHGMHPAAVLRLLRGLGGGVGRVLVVGCRPAVVGEAMGLSGPVCAVVDEAVRLVAELAAAEAGGPSEEPAPTVPVRMSAAGAGAGEGRDVGIRGKRWTSSTTG
jgi:hydrogenase maturation protease